MSIFVGLVKSAFSGIWGYVAAGLATLVAILAALSKAKKAGRDEVIVEGAKKGSENVRKANEADQKLAATKPSDKRKRLRDKWQRD